MLNLLESALAETIGIACCSLLRDAVDEVIKQDIPKVGVEGFFPGHLSALGAEN